MAELTLHDGRVKRFADKLEGIVKMGKYKDRASLDYNFNEEHEDKHPKSLKLTKHINGRIELCYVYKLHDPTSGYFYIGSATNPSGRYYYHLESMATERAIQNCHKKFKELGIIPEMEILKNGVWTRDERFINENKYLIGNLGTEKCLNRMIAGKRWHWMVANEIDERYNGSLYSPKKNMLYDPKVKIKVKPKNKKQATEILDCIIGGSYLCEETKNLVEPGKSAEYGGGDNTDKLESMYENLDRLEISGGCIFPWKTILVSGISTVSLIIIYYFVKYFRSRGRSETR